MLIPKVCNIFSMPSNHSHYILTAYSPTKKPGKNVK